MTGSLREGILPKEPAQEASATPNTGCKAQGGHLAQVIRTPAAFLLCSMQTTIQPQQCAPLQGTIKPPGYSPLPHPLVSRRSTCRSSLQLSHLIPFRAVPAEARVHPGLPRLIAGWQIRADRKIFRFILCCFDLGSFSLVSSDAKNRIHVKPALTTRKAPFFVNILMKD